MTQQVGLRGVFDLSAWSPNVGKYIADMTRIQSATKGISAFTNSATKSVTEQGKAYQQASFGLLSFSRVARLLTAVPLAKIAYDITNAFMSIPGAVFDAVATVQNMQVSLETLAAKEIFAAGATNSVSDAMQYAAPRAKELLGFLRELSVASPFTYQQVAQAYQLQVAFGQTTESAKGTTQAILDFAAGTGQTQDEIQRFAYNLGQIGSSGKIMARDIRELALTRFSILDLANVFEILSKNTKTVIRGHEDFNAAVAAGKITVADFFMAFQQYVDLNFKGAAERMRKTIQGVMSTFSDVFTFAAVDTLTPMFEQLAAAANGLLESFLSWQKTGALADFGIQLGAMTSIVMDAFEEMGKAAGIAGGDIFGGLGDSLSAAAESALKWGINISASLAQGMIEGAVAAITVAMDFISGLLSSFLAPGSPPKVAPDIDKWGASAFEEYLNGFNEADFSALDSLQGTLKQILSSFDFRDISMKIAEALTNLEATGTPGFDIFGMIKTSSGDLGNALSELARRQFAVVSATKAQQEAAKRLEETNKRVTESEQTRNKQIDEYNALLRGGASKEVLRNKLLEVRAADKKLASDRQDLKLAEKGKTAADEKLEYLKDQASLQEKVVAQLLEMAKALNQEEKMVKALKKALKEMGGEMEDAIKFPKPDIGGLTKDIDDALGRAKKLMLDKLKELFAPFAKTAIGKGINFLRQYFDIRGALDQVNEPHARKYLEDQLKALMPSGDFFKEFFKAALGEEGEKFVDSFRTLMGKIGTAADNISRALGPVGDFLDKILSDPKLVENIGRVAGAVLALSAAFSAIGAIASGITAVGTVILTLVTPVGLLVVALGGLIYTIQTLGPTAWGSIQMLGTIFRVGLKTIGDMIGMAGALWEMRFQAMWALINNITGQFFANGIAGWITFFASIDTLITGAMIAWTIKFNEFKTNVLDALQRGWDAVRDAVQGVWNKIGEFINFISGLVLPDWIWLFVAHSPTPLEEGLINVGSAAVVAGQGFWGTPATLGGAMANLKDVLGGANGLLSDFEKLKGIAGSAVGTIGNPLAEALFIVRDAASEAGSAVGGIWQGLEGIKSMNGLVTHVWVITHEQTIREPEQQGGGGSGGGGGEGGGGGWTPAQHGGYFPSMMRTLLHPGEVVLSADMVSGKEPVPNRISRYMAPGLSQTLWPSKVQNVSVEFSGPTYINDPYEAAVHNRRIVRVVREALTL